MLKTQTFRQEKADYLFQKIAEAIWAPIFAKLTEYNDLYNDVNLDIIVKYLLEINASENFHFFQGYDDQIKGNMYKALLSVRQPYGSIQWIKEVTASIFGCEVKQVIVNNDAPAVIDITIVVDEITSDVLKFISARVRASDSLLQAKTGENTTNIAGQDVEILGVMGEFLRNVFLELFPIGYYITAHIEIG